MQGIRVAAMLAAPYSGATLFAMLLDRDPYLACDGETFSDRPSQTCSCGRPQLECEYFDAVAGHMKDRARGTWDGSLFGHVPVFSSNRFLNRALSVHYSPSLLHQAQQFVCSMGSIRKKLSRFVDAHEKFFRRSLEYKGADVYVDGSKIPRRADIMARDRRFNFRIIHLVRDGRGFSNSYRKNTNTPNLEIAAHRWNAEIRKVDEFQSRHPSVAVLRVRYEDLCRNLEQSMLTVREFLSLPTDDLPDFARPGDHHVIGNRMRNSFDGVIREDLAWRESITGEELMRINEIMHKGLARFGYDTDSAP